MKTPFPFRFCILIGKSERFCRISSELLIFLPVLHIFAGFVQNQAIIA